MKKVIVRVHGGVDTMEIVSEPTPEPKAGEVLIQTHSIAVGWPDVLIRSGSYRWMPPLPVTLGNELTGRIAAVGKGVNHLKPGARSTLARGSCPGVDQARVA